MSLSESLDQKNADEMDVLIVLTKIVAAAAQSCGHTAPLCQVDLGIMHEQVHQQIKAGAELTLDYTFQVLIAGTFAANQRLFLFGEVRVYESVPV